MLNSLFSIITPTYNCEEFILRSYFLLQSQTEKSWEWILVDDGSTDKTKEIVESINDTRVVFLTYEINKGRGFARNLGLAQARGKIIVVWDIDDIYLPNRLEVIKDNIYNCDFFVSKALVVDNSLTLKGVRSFSKNKLYTSFVHPTLAFSSDVKNKIHYDETMTAGEDLESMIFLTNKCKGFFYDEPLMLYVEDREINLKKTLISNLAHARTIKKVFNLKISNIRAGEYFKIILKLKIKILILKLFKLNPKLYLFTIKLRTLDVKARNNIDYLNIIDEIKIKINANAK